MVSSESPSRIHAIERRFRAILNPSTNRCPLPLKAKLIVSLLASCLLLPLAVRLGAQNTSSELTGTVFDISGAAVPNATVLVVNHKTDKVDMTTSGSEGHFNFDGLAAGEYELRVVAGGFAEYNVPEIVLQPNREFSQNITLKPGWVTEEVNVVAEGRARTEKSPRVRLGGDIQAAKLLNKVQPTISRSGEGRWYPGHRNFKRNHWDEWYSAVLARDEQRS